MNKLLLTLSTLLMTSCCIFGKTKEQPVAAPLPPKLPEPPVDVPAALPNGVLNTDVLLIAALLLSIGVAVTLGRIFLLKRAAAKETRKDQP
jgi:hypothetical protein